MRANLIGVAQAAREAAVSETAIRDWVDRRRVRSTVIAGRRLIYRDSLEAFVRERQAKLAAIAAVQ